MHASTASSWTLTPEGRATLPSASGATIRHTSSLVGREQEIAAVADRVLDEGLVLVTGAAGVGKSALALRVAQRLAPGFACGYRAIDATRAVDCEHVRAMITAAIRRATPSPDAPAERPGERRGLLLLVDNCDRQAACVAGLARTLRRACPDVHVVLTGRRLDLPGAASLALRSLAFPPHGGSLDASAALAFPAVRLFVQEAARHVPAFALTEENTRGATDVCRRVEGLPLAIKLAAAWVPHVPMGSLAALLGPELLHRLGSEPAHPIAAEVLPRLAARAHRAAASRERRH